MSIPIKCILAVDIANGIANDFGIPWKIKEDMKFFQEITTTCKGKGAYNAVIMGRKTYESIGTPLKNRLNIVITSNPILNNNECVDINNVIQFSTFELATQWLNLQTALYIESIFVIGGKQLYEMCFETGICEQIYITKIFGDYKTTLKININLDQYNLENESRINVVDNNDPERGAIEIRFLTYTNKTVTIKNPEEMQYLKLLNDIITTGDLRPTRNAKTYALFGKFLEFDLKKGFPLLTTKKMFLRGIFEELKFFLLGETDTKILESKGVNIWKGNTSREFLDANGHSNYEEGDMGPMYGFQFRHFGAEYKGCKHDYTGEGIDQFAEVINLLKTDRYSRRILMTTYNPAQSKEGVLYPCHGLTVQFAVEGGNELVCAMDQRSMDCFLGAPFNIASYALLVHIICSIVNNGISEENHLVPGRLVMFLGDTHVYEDHFGAVQEQLKNSPNRFPKLTIIKQIMDIEDIQNLEFNDIRLIGYNSHNSIKAQMIA